MGTYCSVLGKCPWVFNCDFGLHGIEIPYICIEAATVTLELQYMGTCP